MAYFNKDKNSNGGNDSRNSGERSFGKDRSGNRRFGGNRGGSRPDMHSAKCSECGNACEVPFRPTGEKPVYCSDCFRRRRNENSQDGGKSYSGNRDSKSRYEEKPSYQNSGSQNTENHKAQFENLNTKLDKILRVLSSVGIENAKTVDIAKAKELEKASRKEVDTVGLKEVIVESIPKTSAPKKKAVKKGTTKKTSTKKKLKKIL